MNEQYRTKFLAAVGEDVENYMPGGYHPLLIGDELKDGRYKIIHKLGHGGSATVWLAQDTYEESYVAIKVLQASASKSLREIEVQRYLSKSLDFACAPITKIVNYFTVRGINGRHICLVLDVHGPSLGNLPFIKFRPDHARNIAKQVAEAIRYLHRHGVAFGDLSSSNVLLDCTDFSSFSTEALYKTLGEPYAEKVRCVAGDQSVAKHAPEWVYEPIRFVSLDLNLLKPRIFLADLNEAQRVIDPATEYGNGYHTNYAAPERIFGVSRQNTKATDIWALACLFYSIRGRKALVRNAWELYEGHTIQLLIGPPPLNISEAAKRQADEADDLEFITEEEFAESEGTLKHRLQDIGAWKPWHGMTHDERRSLLQSFYSEDIDIDIESKLDTGPPPPARLSEEELTDFHDLLSNMLVWDPEKRFTIDQILAHPWLHKKYEDLDEQSEQWIQRYDTGCTSYSKISCSESIVSGPEDEEDCEDDRDNTERGASDDKDELLTTPLTESPVPTEEDAEDEEAATPEVSEIFSDTVAQSDGGSDATEYSATSLQGPIILHQETVEYNGFITKG